MFNDHCKGDFKCLSEYYMPYVGVLGLGLGTAILAPYVLPAVALEASLFGVGTEAVIASGAMAL